MGWSAHLGGGLLSLGLEHGLHLLPLALGEVVGADALLQELEAPLLLADPEQLLGALLIRGKAYDLADEISHVFVVFGQFALG